MKILEEIKKEHYEVENYFLLMENDEEKAPEIFKEMAIFLLSHHESEEAVVFPELSRKKEVAELKKNIIAEHDEIRRCVQLVLETPDADKMWAPRCHVLKDLVLHHMEEEEGEVFKTMREELSEKELDSMYTAFEKHFKDVKNDVTKRVNDSYVLHKDDVIPGMNKNSMNK